MILGRPDPLRVEFHLLDRQIVDVEGQLVGKVDDVELAANPDGTYRVEALLVGQYQLGERIGGPLGWLMCRLAQWLDADEIQPLRITYDHVKQVSSDVTLSLRAEVLEVPPLERWLRDHVIGRIPGAAHASE
jgi:sporulation protein YlmC with PRC-barrel domain